jgi:nucleoside-diphosphate-sugar epimerase
VGDVVEANILAMENNASDNIFNIGTSIETSVSLIFNLLREIINPAINAKYGPPKLGEQQRSIIENTKAKKTLHWEPKISLRSGLERTCKYFETYLKPNIIKV